MTSRLIFTSKTYRWIPPLFNDGALVSAGYYIPNPGVTRTVQRKGETRGNARARTDLMRQRTGSNVELQL